MFSRILALVNRLPDPKNWKQWLPLIALLRLPLFLYKGWCFFEYEFHPQAGWMVQAADSRTFYEPLISWMQGNGYGLPCRLPGLGFPFVPLAWLFGSELARNLVIILQFTATSISCYLLALIAIKVFGKRSIFLLVVLLYALFPLIASFDWKGSADSFHVSILIGIVWMLISEKFRTQRGVFLIGAILAWGIFVKEIFVLLTPLFALYIFLKTRKNQNLQTSIKRVFILGLPSVLALAAWTGRNYSLYNKFIPLRAPVDWCYSSINPEVQACWKLVAAWGEDIGRFGPYSDWFRSEKYGDKDFPYRKDFMTSEYNLDSLSLLKDEVLGSLKTRQNITVESKSATVIKAQQYLESFKKEHPFQYYLGGRLSLLRKLWFPLRLDGLPFPAFSEMNVFQKLMKGSGVLLWLLSSISLLLAPFVFFKSIVRRNYDVLLLLAIPLAVAFSLSFIVGFVEQRYYLTALPFALVWFVAVLDNLISGALSKGLELRKW